MMRWLLKNTLKEFEAILKDASKVFNRALHDVNVNQFKAMAKGRFSQQLLGAYGYTPLKNAVAPRPDTTKQEAKAARAMIERLLKNA
jgi:shikimate 5-dehydrogenase